MRKANLYKYAGFFLIAVCATGVARAGDKIDQVVVSKSAARLYLQSGGKTIETFKVVFGAQPQGHKQQQGDERTPEGNYFLDAKNNRSKFYKAIHISYPNAADRALAKRLDVLVGGDIMIHGQPNGWGWISLVTQSFNWTDGCIALSNHDMEIVWRAVETGTPIKILP